MFTALLIGAALFSAGALAQEGSDDGTGAVTDNRINQGFFLGGIGVYCENMPVQVEGETSQTVISVWGTGGRQLIVAPVPPMDEPLFDEQIGGLFDFQFEEGFINPQGQVVTMVDQARGPNGLLTLWRIGNESNFQLNGFYEDGKPFAFNWTGCGGESTSLITGDDFFGESQETQEQDGGTEA
jgi:hypothetical protein